MQSRFMRSSSASSKAAPKMIGSLIKSRAADRCCSERKSTQAVSMTRAQTSAIRRQEFQTRFAASTTHSSMSLRCLQKLIRDPASGIPDPVRRLYDAFLDESPLPAETIEELNKSDHLGAFDRF